MSLAALRDDLKLEDDIVFLREEEPGPPCLIFRGQRYFTWTDTIFRTELHQGMRLLKKRSCLGCLDCLWFFETIYQRTRDGRIIMPVVKHNALYTVKQVKLKKYIEFIPYEE